MQGRYQKIQESLALEYRELKAKKISLENEVRRLKKQNREMVTNPSIFRLEDRSIKKNKAGILLFKKKIAVVQRKIDLKANEFKTQKDVLRALSKAIAARTVQEQNLVIKVLALGAPKIMHDTRDSVKKSVAPHFEKIQFPRDLVRKMKWPLAFIVGLSLTVLVVLARRRVNWVFLQFRRSAKPKSPAIDLPADLQQEIEGLNVAAKDRIQYI